MVVSNLKVILHYMWLLIRFACKEISTLFEVLPLLIIPLLIGYVKVMGISHSLFEHELESLKNRRGVSQDTDLTTDDLKELVESYKGVYKKATGKHFPAGKDLVMYLHVLFL